MQRSVSRIRSGLWTRNRVASPAAARRLPSSTATRGRLALRCKQLAAGIRDDAAVLREGKHQVTRRVSASSTRGRLLLERALLLLLLFLLLRLLLRLLLLLVREQQRREARGADVHRAQDWSASQQGSALTSQRHLWACVCACVRSAQF